MISEKDRSGWFGASDTDKIVGNTETKSFESFWLEKLGLIHNDFRNESLIAGTFFEHPILESLGLSLEMDKQVLLPELRLRVNLDGNTTDTIYEVKTHNAASTFAVPLKYKRQVWVQMFASGVRKAYIVAYGLEANDYKNYFNPICKDRLMFFPIEYDETFIQSVYLPRLQYFKSCLESGVFPK